MTLVAPTFQTLTPFQLTKDSIQHLKNTFALSSPTCAATARKVGKVVLALLCVTLGVILDLILVPILWCRNARRPTSLNVPEVARGITRDAVHPVPLQLNSAARTLLLSTDDLPLGEEFLRAVIGRALHFNTPAKRDEYRDLLRHHGEPLTGEPSIDIFQWSAACAIAQYLIYQFNNPLNDQIPAFLAGLDTRLH